ncbi:MAG: hypothetical protein U0Q16_39670 [Bryobacteraceae bacterium]
MQFHSRIVSLSALSFVLWVTPAVRAQLCSGPQDFSGPYVFTAERLLYAPVTVTPPGSTGEFSTTTVGALARAGSGVNVSPVSISGRVLGDGAGLLFQVDPTDSSSVRIGTYTVNTDCTMQMKIQDVFAKNSAFSSATITFNGVLQDRGGEANLSSGDSQLLVSFVRPFLANGCSNSTLSGAYGVSGSAVSLGDSGTQATSLPFTIIGRFWADGSGAFTVDSAAGAQPKMQLTGTYKVNSDCTGSATWVLPGDTTIGRKVAFVLAQSQSPPGLQGARAALRFALTEGKLAGTGLAK